MPHKNAVVIHYPGYVQNEEAAIRNMGGIDGVSASHLAHDRDPLQVKCRPTDGLSHPLFAERVRGRALLLKVSPQTSSSDGSSQGVKAEVVARVNVSYRFTGIADFQYISTTRVTGTPEGGAHAHDVDLPAASGPFGKEQENLEVVPPLFTKQDYEFEYGFRSDIASSKEKTNFAARAKAKASAKAASIATSEAPAANCVSTSQAPAANEPPPADNVSKASHADATNAVEPQPSAK